MDLIALIDAAVDRLNAKLESLGATAEAWDEAKEYPLLTENARVIVGYLGDDSAGPRGVGCVVQEEKLKLGVTVKAKSLRYADRTAPASPAYAVTETVKRALRGWRPDPDDDRQMYHVSTALVGIDERTFIYGMQFAIERTAVEIEDDFVNPKLAIARFYRNGTEEIHITNNQNEGN